MTDIKLIGVEPSQDSIDLSQALSLHPLEINLNGENYSSAESEFFGKGNRELSDAVDDLRNRLAGVVDDLKQRVLLVMGEQDAAFVKRMDELTSNINAVFNDIDARLTASSKDNTEIREALASFIRLILVTDKMEEAERADHTFIVEQFLQQTAVLSVQTDEIPAKETI
jgi:hypothetical protein